jgi:hypothetical protein
MYNSRIQRKVLSGKFNGRKSVGRTRMRWEDIIRRESFLLLNMRGWRRQEVKRDIWRRTIEEAGAYEGEEEEDEQYF